MKTRSQTRNTSKSTFPVEIDFDDASACWRQNKKVLPNGMYKYICTQLKRDGKPCGIACYKTGDTCWIHRSKSGVGAK